MNKVNLKNINLYLFVTTLMTLISCSKSNEYGNAGDSTVATVEVNLSGSEFEAVQTIGNRAAAPYLTEIPDPEVMRNTLDIGNDMLLIAEISPDYSLQNAPSQARTSTKDRTKAAIETGNLGTGVRYRVVVFNSDGTFNRQQEYIRGSEATAPPMFLDGGRTYTFIAYSINTTAAVPQPTFTGGQQNLASTVVSVAGNQDFMYFRRDLTLVGGPTPNRLDIVLKHRFSQITTIINATQTGYNPTNITASFAPHSNTALINLNTGAITRNAQADRSSVTTAFTEGTTIASYATIVNAVANEITNYIIESLSIGSLTLTNLTPFVNLTVTPGVKYNLTLNIVPTDEYLIHEGRPAARINGIIWARHNIGVDTSVDPDAEPMDASRHGNYYQWGRNVSSGGPTVTTANPFINNNRPGNTTWNSGTELAPVKTINDPCPTGFRIPTKREQEILIGNVSTEQTGTTNDSPTNYSTALILTSRRNSSVRLTMPYQGFINATGNANDNTFTNSTITGRGAYGVYFNSLSNGTAISYLRTNSAGLAFVDLATHNRNKVVSRTIRCISSD